MERKENDEMMEQFDKMLDESLRSIQVGEILECLIADIDDNKITLDLNYYAPGIVPFDQISADPNFQPKESFHVGDSVKATVLALEDNLGNVILSIKDASERIAWASLEQYKEEKTEISVTVAEAVKGGLVTYVNGIRGFIPASQISLSYVENLETYKGQTLQVRVTECDKTKNRLILSSKIILAEKEQEQREHAIANMIPGSILEGKVESIKPYGAFIDLGNGISGLVHISQICQKRIKSPSEILSLGETVTAKLLKIEDGKVSLSIKALEEVEEPEVDPVEDSFEYKEDGMAATSLSSLLSAFHFE